MNIYERFALFYAKGPYPKYSERMVELLPAVLERFGVHPHTLLDLACGEGTFAVAMARNGLRVMAIDRSPQMLQLAEERARRENADVQFAVQDMRALLYEERFDLVTCWYDSLNYVLEANELETVFMGVCRALRRDGLFVFDMNTIHGLAVTWQEHLSYVQQDTDDLFEVHRVSYDYEKNLAGLRITGFARQGATWVRIDETHQERAYSLEEIRRCLERAGLTELACWGNLGEMSEIKPDSPRVWFVATK